MYRLVFIITCTDTENILSCIKSISKHNKSVELLCLVLLQNNIRLSFDHLQTQFTNIKAYQCDKIIPLSVARNILLSECPIIDTAYYMFPDDDSLFDSTFFCSFDRIVKSNTLIAVKATQDRKSYFLEMPMKKVAQKRDYAKAISVNMVIRGKIISMVGPFDEELGVGNYYGAGEDNDYFLRCNSIERFTFSNDIWNYHPLQGEFISLPTKKLISRYESYGRGVVYMLLKHKMYLHAFWIVIKGYLGALLYFIKTNFKMAWVYFKASNSRLKTFLKNI